MDFDIAYRMLTFLTQFLAVPLVIVLWRLNNAISDLRFTMGSEYITRREVEKRVDDIWRKLENGKH